MIFEKNHHKAHKTQQLNICAKLFYLQKQNGTKWQQGSHIHAQLSLIECSAEKLYLVSKDLGKALHRAEEMFVIKLLQRMCIIPVWTYSLHLMFPEPRDDPSTFFPYIQSITTEFRKQRLVVPTERNLAFKMLYLFWSIQNVLRPT